MEVLALVIPAISLKKAIDLKASSKPKHQA